MTLRPVLLLIAVLTFASFAAAQTAFDGKWTAEVKRPAPNPNQNLTITLKTDAGKVSGSVVGADPADSPIEWGFVKGDLITFKVKMQVANSPQTMVYVGKINGNQIEFGRRPENLTVGQLVEFTAQKSN
jgi:hypothetical protein